MNVDHLGCISKIKQLQEVIKIYLMAVSGTTTQLGGVTYALMDILADCCNGEYTKVSKQLEEISISIVKIIYTSMIESLRTDDTVAIAMAESETELLPHLLFMEELMSSVIGDKNNKDDRDMASYTAIVQKLRELIDVTKH